MSASGSTETAVILLAIIVLILVRRTVSVIQGTTYSAGRVFGTSVFYTVLYGALAASTIAAAVGLWGDEALLLIAPYAAVVVGAALVAAPYVRRIVHFEPNGTGGWTYRLPWTVPALYLALFIVRVVVELVVFGPAVLSTFTLPPVPATTLFLVIGVDLLYSGSTGLLLGRAVGTYLAYREIERTPPAPPATPLPSRPLP